MKFILSIISFLLISTSLFAQQNAERFQLAVVPAKFGIKVVYTSNKSAVTLDVVAKDAKPIEHPGVVLVGKQILQFHFTPATQDSLRQSTEQQKQLLLNYLKYETDYAKQQLKMEEMVTTTEWLTINNKLYLLWSYNLDKDDQSNVIKQYYLCTLSFNNVLTINTPIIKGDNEEASKALMMQIGRTLMQFDTRIDIDKLYKALQ